MVPGNLRYTKSHEWAALHGDIATVGITQFAANQLTDITYIDLPAVGKQVQAGESCGNIETVKAVSDLYSPVTGEVVEQNSGLTSDAGPLTGDPYGAGWLFRVRVSGPDALAHLLSPEDYQKQIESEAH
ncbi:MAG: glycine cleavage system protein GcvH [Gemmataceae bacterium]